MTPQTAAAPGAAPAPEHPAAFDAQAGHPTATHAQAAPPRVRRPVAPDGIVVVDKPAGWTSHDVVGRLRTLAGTRRVGHAGTLDPMATGVLVVGIGRATRLLGHVAGADKTYEATIRLGRATVTDDAEGEPLGGAPAHELPMAAVDAAIAALTGAILQRPSAVSAIKVDGRRAHDRVRAGEEVELPERPVTVRSFAVLDRRADAEAGTLDLDVVVDCSSGTYIRALARDLGLALGVGGHLTALRRTRVGVFTLADARSLDQLAEDLAVTPMDRAASLAFPVIRVTEADEGAVRHGRSIDLGPAWGAPGATPAGHPAPGTALDGPHPHALVSRSGEFLALVTPRPDGWAQYLAVFVQP